MGVERLGGGVKKQEIKLTSERRCVLKYSTGRRTLESAGRISSNNWESSLDAGRDSFLHYEGILGINSRAGWNCFLGFFFFFQYFNFVWKKRSARPSARTWRLHQGEQREEKVQGFHPASLVKAHLHQGEPAGADQLTLHRFLFPLRVGSHGGSEKERKERGVGGWGWGGDCRQG